jgi:YD repeat-containing protein
MRTRSSVSIAAILALSGALAGSAIAQVSAEQAQSAGPGHPWQGALSGVNPFSLSRETSIPLVAWTARGGLPVSFELHHSSLAVHSNPALAPKWTHSYDTHVETWDEQGVQMAAVVWGDQRSERFTMAGGVLTPVDGYRDTLATTANGYLLTLKSGDKLEFVSTPQEGHYHLWRITDPNNNRITLAYDGLNRLIRITDPSARQLRLTYSATTGQLSKVRFVVGTFTRTWSLAYNAQSGQLASVAWPLVTTDAGDQILKTRFAYNAGGNIATLTDRAGKQWKYGYSGNALAWAQWPGSTVNQRVKYAAPQTGVATVTDASGVKTTYEYDGMSRLVRVKDAQGNTLSRSYADTDYPWLPSLIAAPSGDTIQADYDARGNAIAVIDAAGNRTDLTWDAKNRLTTVLEPLVTDAWGIAEPMRHRTDYTYDGRNNLIRVREFAAANSFFDITYTVDVAGLVTSRDVMGNATTYAYDLHGNPTQTTSPAGRSVQALYEAPETTLGYTQPNAVIDGLGLRGDRSYDQWGRLRAMSNPDGSSAAYAYDAMSRLVMMGDSTGTTSWAYNAAGLMIDESSPSGSVHTDYLPSGRPSQLIANSAAGLRTIQYAYDSRGLPSSVSTTVDNDDLEIVFQYDAAGRMTSRALSNGAHSAYAYAGGRLGSITHYDLVGAIIASFDYDYQANGFRMSAIESDGGITRYGYDLLNRPAREERSGASPYTLFWSYDNAGNRIQESRDGAVTFFSYDPDGLVQTANTPTGPNDYQWDQNARLAHRTADGVSDQFSYDFNGRLTRIDEFNGVQWMPSREYRYDGLDRRVQRQAFGGWGEPIESITFNYDAFTPLGQTTQSQQGISSASMTFAAGLAAYTDDQGSFFPATDATGAVRAATDDSGHSVGLQASFDIFGNPTVEDVQWIPFSFAADAGARTDGDAGLTYTGSGAYYDPKIVLCTDVDSKDWFDKNSWIYASIGPAPLDPGSLTAQISSAELSFQTDGPIICQALFQRLAPRAPIVAPVMISCQDGNPALQNQTLENLTYNYKVYRNFVNDCDSVERSWWWWICNHAAYDRNRQHQADHEAEFRRRGLPVPP